MPNTTKTFDMIIRYLNYNWVWLALFVLSSIYLFVVANKRQKWALVAILMSLCLFINDFVLNFVENVAGERQRYYRYLWVIPFMFFIVTAIVDVYRRWKHIVPRALIIAISLGLFIYLYQDRGWFDALPDYNINVLPDGIVAISDKLEASAEEKSVFVVVPKDLLYAFDMYNGKIYCFTDSSIIKDDEMGRKNLSSSEPDVEGIMSVCCDKGMDYIVIRLNDTCRLAYEEKGYRIIYENSGLGLLACRGYEGISMDYTPNGQIERITYIDERGNPRLIHKGYSTVRYKYSKLGYVIEESFYDEKNDRCYNQAGCSKIIYERDYKGNTIKESYYDINNEPIITADGYAAISYIYDKKNLCIKEMYFDEKGNAYKQMAGYYGKSIEYDSNDDISAIKYLDKNGETMDRKDGYSEVRWEENTLFGTRDVFFYDMDGNNISLEKLNLVRNVRYDEKGWSKWMTPQKDTVNSCFNIGYVNLGPKKEGDVYTCYICVEFSDVSVSKDKKFGFWTQGPVDGGWDARNVWNSSFIDLDEPPLNGEYCFKTSVEIKESMLYSSEYGIEFRCDNWESGSFRVRDVMIVKSENEEEWAPGL